MILRLTRPKRPVLALGLSLGGVLLVAILALVALGLWVGLTAKHLQHNLAQAEDAASQLHRAALAEDNDGVTAALTSLQHYASAAREEADSKVWGLATHLPHVGTEARGVRTIADVADRLSHHGLPQLAGVLGKMNVLLPHGGRIDTTELAHLRQPIAQGRMALDRAMTDLANVDAGSFPASARSKFLHLRKELATARSVLDPADTALSVLPTMLGATHQQRYLLVFENNAELRATGGFAGAVAMITANHGKITLSHQMAGKYLGPIRPGTVLPLLPGETRLWSSRMGVYFLDANFSPDYPRVAALWRARWNEQYPHVDGVIAVDTVTLSYLLDASGPVKVDGREITSANAVRELLSTTYLRLPTELAAQDAFFRDVASAVFKKLSTGSGSPSDYLSALRRAANEHRVLIHSFVPKVQRVIAATPMSGSFQTAKAKNPQIGVAVNLNEGSKMTYYLRYQTHLRATSCTGGVQKYRGTIHLHSLAPLDSAKLPVNVNGAWEPGVAAGDMLMWVDLIAPPGGTVTVTGRGSAQVRTAILKGRKVEHLTFWLPPQKSATFTWTMTSAKGSTGPTDVSVTPSVQPGSDSFTAASLCAG